MVQGNEIDRSSSESIKYFALMAFGASDLFAMNKIGIVPGSSETDNFCAVTFMGYNRPQLVENSPKLIWVRTVDNKHNSMQSGINLCPHIPVLRWSAWTFSVDKP